MISKVNFHWVDERSEHKRVLELLKKDYSSIVLKKLGSKKWDEVKMDLFKVNGDVIGEITAYRGDYFGDDFEGLTKSFKIEDVFNQEEGDN